MKPADANPVIAPNAGATFRSPTGDSVVRYRAYTGGQALFDARNPVELLDRTDAPFIRPTEPYEKSGRYAKGTTFVEGLVPFRGRRHLYYGTAHSRVGVAVWTPNAAPPVSGAPASSAPAR